jgi:hypothetical protein
MEEITFAFIPLYYKQLVYQQVFLDDHGLNEEHVDLVPVELGGVTLPHRVKVLDAVL